MELEVSICRGLYGISQLFLKLSSILCYVSEKKFKDNLELYKAIDELTIIENRDPEEFYRKILCKAQQEANNFPTWRDSLTQSEHQNWFKGNHTQI